ncbi:hypothetical protein SEA_KEELAN_8 [Gordonia phage Keelan]|nr:hypothetical protein SEA_KEELAN_8 [Gordonia phage Keelan]
MIRWTIKKEEPGWIVRRWDDWPYSGGEPTVTWTSEPFPTFEMLLGWKPDCKDFLRGWCSCRLECAY